MVQKYYIIINDGYSPVTSPGTKVKIRGSVSIINGFMLLKKSSLEVMGGSVETLLKKWNPSKVSSSAVVIFIYLFLFVCLLLLLLLQAMPDMIDRRKRLEEDGPPQFVSFSKLSSTDIKSKSRGKTKELKQQSPIPQAVPTRELMELPQSYRSHTGDRDEEGGAQTAEMNNKCNMLPATGDIEDIVSGQGQRDGRSQGSVDSSHRLSSTKDGDRGPSKKGRELARRGRGHPIKDQESYGRESGRRGRGRRQEKESREKYFPQRQKEPYQLCDFIQGPTISCSLNDEENVLEDYDYDPIEDRYLKKATVYHEEAHSRDNESYVRESGRGRRQEKESREQYFPQRKKEPYQLCDFTQGPTISYSLNDEENVLEDYDYDPIEDRYHLKKATVYHEEAHSRDSKSHCDHQHSGQSAGRGRTYDKRNGGKDYPASKQGRQYSRSEDVEYSFNDRERRYPGQSKKYHGQDGKYMHSDQDKRHPDQDKRHPDQDRKYHDQDRRHHDHDRRHHDHDRRHHDHDRRHPYQDRRHHDHDRRHPDQDRRHHDHDRRHHDHDRRHHDQDRKYHGGQDRRYMHPEGHHDLDKRYMHPDQIRGYSHKDMYPNQGGKQTGRAQSSVDDLSPSHFIVNSASLHGITSTSKQGANYWESLGSQGVPASAVKYLS